MMMSDTGNKAFKRSATTAPNAFGSLRYLVGLLAQVGTGWLSRTRVACFAILLLTVLGARPLMAQKVHPVEVQLQLTPPYSLYLSDYATAEERLKVNLFLKDLTKADHPFRLKLKIEGFGITIVSKNNFYTPPIYLTGGQMRVLSGPELQDYFNPQNLMFQGIDLKTFNQNGAKLPEGVYRISIGVEDYTRRQVVSNAGGTVLSAFLSYPPVINQPMAEAKVRALFPQNLIFQWMPRHTASINAAFNVAYRIRLVELDQPGRNPNDAIRSMRPLFETVTNQTQYVYGPADPQLTPGHTYALQVQAIDVNGRDAFVNQGYSEVVRFTYGEKCSQPLSLIAQLEDRNSLKLSWTQLPMQQRYAVRYREANNPKAEWFEQEIFATQFSVRGLRPGTTYEYQVKAACDYGFGDYTMLQTFTLPNEALTTGDIACGIPSQLQAPTNKELLPILQPGMLFMAASFPVNVTEVTSQGDRFTGRGIVGVPYLNKLNFEVEFKDIQINTDLKLISGKVSVRRQSLEQSQEAVLRAVTVTPDKSGVVEAVASNGLPTIIDAAVAEPGVLPVFTSSPAKTVTFAGILNSGEKKEITIKLKEGQPPIVFQDKNGETYEVDESGKVTHRGKVPTSGLLAGGVLSSQQLATDKATVTFHVPSDHKYGLDNFQQDLASNSRYAQDYQQVQTSQGSARVGWKSVESGRGDVVLAEVKLLDKNLELAKLEFRNGEHEKLPSRQLNGSNKFTFDVMGAPEGNDKEVYAFYPTSEDGKTGLYLGKLNIASFRKITKKVIVVPVNGNGASFSKEAISAYLNEVYKQAVIEWDVRITADFKADAAKWDVKSNGLDAGNSGVMNAYTDDQKALANLYRENNPLEKGTYYLFLVDRFSESTQKGYMVRGGQVGFVAAGGQQGRVLHTMAHELGHGAFALQHTWDVYGEPTEGSTDNLMDYSKDDSIQLWYRQWKYMRKPDIIFRPFEGDDAGAALQMLLAEELHKSTESEEIYTFLTPDGVPFSINSKDVERYTYHGMTGCLTGFYIKSGTGSVLYSYDKNSKAYLFNGKPYSVNNSPAGTYEVLLFERAGACDVNIYKATYTYTVSDTKVVLPNLAYASKWKVWKVTDCSQNLDNLKSQYANRFYDKAKTLENFVIIKDQLERITLLIEQIGDNHYAHYQQICQNILQSRKGYYNIGCWELNEYTPFDELEKTLQHRLRLSTELRSILSSAQTPDEVDKILATVPAEQLHALTTDERLRAIRILSQANLTERWFFIDEDRENLVVKLVSTSSKDKVEIKKFFDGLQEAGLLNTLVDKLHDTRAGIIGDNNFTAFINELVSRFNTLHIAAENQLLNSIDQSKAFYFGKHITSINGRPYEEFSYYAPVGFSDNTVSISGYNAIKYNLTSDREEVEKIPLNPFEPVAMVFYSKPQNGFINEAMVGKAVPVPAIFLYWYSMKSWSSVAEKSAFDIIQLASLGVAVKEVQFAQKSWAIRAAWADLIINSPDLLMSSPEVRSRLEKTTAGKEFLFYYDVSVGIANLAYLSPFALKFSKGFADRVAKISYADEGIEIFGAKGWEQVKDFYYKLKPRLEDAGKVVDKLVGGTKVGDVIIGKTVQQVRPGTNGIIAVIGRRMEDHVNDVVSTLESQGKRVEAFNDAYQSNKVFNIDGINYTWQQIKDDFTNPINPITGKRKYASINSKGWIADSALPETLMYKANQKWVQKLIDEGYEVIDIGYPKGQNLEPSLFYNMEISTLFP